MRDEIIRARVNIKSLTAEAKIIKDEIRRTNNISQKDMLYAHKTSKLKPEARLANLAIGWLKYKKRSEVENSFKKEIDPIDLFKKIKKYGYFIDSQLNVSMISEWLKT